MRRPSTLMSRRPSRAPTPNRKPSPRRPSRWRSSPRYPRFMAVASGFVKGETIQREIPPYTYEPSDKMPDEYRQAVVHILTIESRIESEYPMMPGKTFAQSKLEKWYPAGLDMFGKSDSTRQYDYIRWGLRRRSNAEMRQAFQDEVDALLRSIGLTPPDPLANRRFL